MEYGVSQYMKVALYHIFLILSVGLVIPCSAQVDTLQLDEVPIIDRIFPVSPSSQSTVFRQDSAGLYPALGIGLDNVLEQVSGLYLRSYGGHGGVKTLSFRGFSAQQSTLSINGMPIRDAQNSLINLNQVFLQGYQQIEVSKVARSIGQNPLGGNIDLSIAPLQKQIRVEAGIGSFGEWLGNALVESKSEKAAYKLAYNYVRAKDNYPFSLNGESGNRRHAAFESHQYQGFWRQRLSNRWALSALAMGSSSQQEIPGPVLTGNPGSSEDRSGQDKLFGYIKTTNRPSSQSWLDIGFSYQNDVLRYDNRLAQQIQRYELQDALGQVHFKWLGTQHLFQANLQTSISHLAGNNLAKDFRPVDFVQRKELNLGVQHRYEASWGKTKLQLESLYRQNFVEGFGALSNAGLNAGFMFPIGKVQGEVFVHGHFGKRIPSFNELYYFGFGNTELQPEDVRSVDLGFVLKPGFLRSRISISAFANQTRNKIISVPINPARWQTFSIGLTQSTGFEGELSLYPIEQLYLYANYTLQKAEDLSRSQNALLPYTPRELFAYGLTFEKKRWAFLINGAYAGWRFSLLQNDQSTLLPAYHLFDAGIRYKMQLGPVNSLINFEVENIMDENYVVIRSYPMPGRSFRLRISLSF